MKRVLVIRLSHLGDIILTEPVIKSISNAYPQAEVEFMTREVYSDVVGLFDGVTRTVTLQIPGRDQSLYELSRTVRRQCGGRYDLVIDLHNNIRSWWIRFRLDYTSGKTYPKNWWTRRKIVKRKVHTSGLHTVDLYLASLAGTGISPSTREPNLKIRDESIGDLPEDDDFFSEDYCVFAVGASHPMKHYPIPQWVELADAVNAEFGYRVLVVESDSYGYLNLFADLQKSGKLRIITGLKLPVLAKLLSSSRLTISNDSGVMHMSAAVGTPTIGLFGPTHPSLGFSPLGRRCRAVTTNECCSPCSRHGAAPCYRDDRYCFTNMSTEIIMKHVREVVDAEL